MNAPAVDAFDVAVVLGAKAEDDGSPSPAMRRRVALGGALLLKGKVRNLLMTGGPTGLSGCEADIMVRLAVQAGVPAALVHAEREALNTIENARYSAQWICERQWRRVAVVTDSFHIPRAWYIFRRFGLRPAMFGARPDNPSWRWWAAHGRELAAFPWTVLRVEAGAINRRGYGG